MLYTLYNHSVLIPKNIDYLDIPHANKDNCANIEVKFSDIIFENKYFIDNQFELKPDYGFYYREGFGLYEFTDGKVINISLEGKADISFFQTLLNFPFACIFAQRGFLPIHASAIRFRDKTILFPGVTKMGKSSLAAILIKMGGQLITEDIALFRLSENEARIIPSYPLIKISDEVNKEISFSSKEPLKILKSDLKRNLFPIDHNDFYNKESEVDFVIFPEWSETEGLMPISQKNCLVKIISSNFFTSGIPLLEKNSLKNNHLVSKNAKCFEFNRSKDLKKLKKFQTEIEKVFS